MKKTVLIVLCAMLLLSSCGTENAETAADTLQETEQTEITETEETKEEFILPERNYEGKTFMFYSTASGDAVNFICRSELSGEAVNDALYATENAVEELYNTKIDVTVSSADNNQIMVDTVQLALAGDSDFHVSYGNSVTAAEQQLAGAFVNLYDIEVFDFSKPWWPKYSVEAMTVGGQMYLGTSYISHAAVASCQVIGMNMDLAKKYNIEAPHQTVLKGKWTLDRLRSLISETYADTNGDGQRDIGDTYGFIGPFWANPLSTALDVAFLEKSDTAPYLSVNVNIEKAQSVMETLYQFAYETTGAWFDLSPISVFTTGNSVFSTTSINDGATVLRDTNFDYSLFPIPKYDEQQESYYTYGQNFAYVIPNVELDLDFVGCVLEALACYRYQDLIPAYSETTLKKKLADNPDDAQMIEIIVASRVEPFERLYKSYYGLMNFAELLQAGNSNFTTFFEANRTAAESKLEALNAFYEAHD